MKTLLTLITLASCLLLAPACTEDTPEPPPNEAPVVSMALPNIELATGFGVHTIDLTGVFIDGDEFDALAFSATTSEENVVTVNTSGTTLSLAEVGALGNSTITVTARDLDGAEAETSFVCTVVQ